MKIAFVTDDGQNISQHFGRASHYLVIEVENGLVSGQEMREKPGHNQFAKESQHQNHIAGKNHGTDHASHQKHSQMFQIIQDCDILICGGMGSGAYQSMQSFGVTPMVTDQTEIGDALMAYLAGELKDQVDRLH